MAEALVAVGIAANVVQFLDVGAKFVSSCWEIYTSSRDGVGELHDLQKIIKDFDEVLSDLERSDHDGKALVGEDRGFQPLVTNCRELASQLLDCLRTINSPTKARKRDAIREAIKRLWNDEISSLQSRLERLRQELIVHLLGLIRRQGQKSMEQQECLQAQIRVLDEGGKRVESAVTQLLDNQTGIGDTILKALVSRTRIVQQEQSLQNLQGHLLSALHHEAAVDEPNDSQAPLVSPKRKSHLQNIFLRRLTYHDMEDREERIAKPYERTFQWIFSTGTPASKSWSNFKDWLESESKLYWITGKAGSGKSTLMKFICQKNTGQGDSSDPEAISQQAERRCYQYLHKWAGDQKLVFAIFYFWNSGVQLQMSQRGLLLTLLSQIVQQTPDIIATVSPRRWESLCLFNEDWQEWNDLELQGMLRSAVREICKSMKICLFIDGLDEFEGGKQELINLVLDLTANSNVKVCVASRPWVDFEDAFDRQPSLMLQDLTYPDIKHFVATNLERDANYDQLRKREQTYADQLVENIVTKSSGVFLWVNLVVNSLLAGMNNGDRVADLQKRLDLMPPDLERLYDKILGSLEPFYLEHATQLFQMVQESRSPIPLIVLYYADEVDLTSAIKQTIKAIPESEQSAKLDAMRRRLNSRCKGLLEVSSFSTDNRYQTVQYLHRTVKDYISSERAQKTLRVPNTSTFNPYQSLCAGYLARVKTLDKGRLILLDELDEPVLDSIDECLYYVARSHDDSPAQTLAVLDELFKVGLQIDPKEQSRWSMRKNLPSLRMDVITDPVIPGHEPPTFHNQSSSLKRRRHFPTFFFALIVHYGMVEYIETQPSTDSNFFSALLFQAIISFYISKKPAFLLKMIECLLDKGADPNFRVEVPMDDPDAETIWLRLIYLIWRADSDETENVSGWHDVLKLMIKYGAMSEELYLREYDPLVQILDEKGSEKVIFVPKPSEFRFLKVQNILSRSTIRLSKALKQVEDFRMEFYDHVSFGLRHQDDISRKLRLYNRIQDIRQQNDTGFVSQLSSRWKRK